MCDKLKELDLIEIPKSYKVVDSSDFNKTFYGYNETDLIIYMLKTVKIQFNYNFRKIINNDLNIIGNKLILEKGKNYIFEIKASIGLILKNITKIENHQKCII